MGGDSFQFFKSNNSLCLQGPSILIGVTEGDGVEGAGLP